MVVLGENAFDGGPRVHRGQPADQALVDRLVVSGREAVSVTG